MGQSSSQAVPNHGQEAVNERAPSRIIVSPKQSSRAMAGRKHARSPSLDDEITVRPPKQAKTDDEQQAKKRRRRSVPQHRRGTAIMPSQDVTMKERVEERPSTSSSNDSRSDNDVVATPQKPSTTQNDKARAGTTKSTSEDGNVVSLIGKPGPRKQKKTKRITQNNEEIRETISAPRQVSARNAFDPDNVADAKAGFEIARKPKSEVAEQPQTKKSAPLANAGPAKAKGTKKEHRETQILESVQVNPVGKPGPPRRKKAKQSPNIPVDPETNANPSTQISRAETQQMETVKTSDQTPAAAADCIPTPPSSAEEQYHEASEHIADPVAGADDADDYEQEYDDTIRPGYVDPTNQIAGWLNSQETPAPPDQIPPSMGSPKRTRKKAAPKKRKEVPAKDEDNNDEYQEDAKAEEESASEIETKPKPKAKCRKKSTKAKGPGAAQATSKTGPMEAEARGVVTGAWSEDDKVLADRIFEHACKEFNASAEDMRYWITDWRENWDGCVAFRTEMLEAFPFRNKAAIRKFCQRRYTMYNTGPWTAEDDQNLIKYHAEFQGHWGDIAGFIDRSLEACRERWIRVVQNAETRETGPWTVEREQELVEAVTKLREVIKSECQDEDVQNDNERLDSMIDWNQCSELLGGKRNAKRCLEKWRILKRRAAVETHPAPAHSFALPTVDPQQLSKKQRAIESAYNKLGWGDVYDAVREVSDAFPDNPAETFPLESTVWSKVATANPNSRFESKVRRRCYYGLLEKFSEDEDVRNAVGFGNKAAEATCLLQILFEEGTLEANRFAKEARKTKKDGAETATKTVKPTSPGIPKRSAEQLSAHDTTGELNVEALVRAQKKHLSEEFVNVSDDEPEANTGDQAQPGEELQTPDNEKAYHLNAFARAVRALEEEDKADAADLDDQQISSVNSRGQRSLRSGTPQLTPDEFMERCTAAGREQHRRYVRAVLEG